MRRRSFLALAAASVGVAACAGPSDRDGSGDRSTPAPPDPEATVADTDVSLLNGTYSSTLRRGRQTRWVIVYPHGHRPGERLPVLVTLHGTGGDEGTPWLLRWAKSSHRLQREGLRPFACAGITGGDTWWHARSDGTDTGAMIEHELLPLLESKGLDVRRPALYGYSMGGYGALMLAQRRGPAATSSVVAASTPFLTRWDQIPGAFDSPADFADHDVRARWPSLRGIPTRVDIGDRDPFLASNQDFVPTASPRPMYVEGSGAHDAAFWGSVAYQELRFVAEHL